MLHRETVAVHCENLTKGIRKSTVWGKCSFFPMFNLLLRIAWRSAKKWVVTFWDIRLSLSFYLLFHIITYTFTPFYAHPNMLYNSCQASPLRFLIAFPSEIQKFVFIACHRCHKILTASGLLCSQQNSRQRTRATKLQRHSTITAWK
jgi:hypothetical protein